MTIEITCPERWREEWKRSIEAERDCVITHQRSLTGLVERLMQHLWWDGTDKVTVSADFCKHSFLFAVYREDGSLVINGGIIFHGLPDTGYLENGSYSIDPQWGWEMHT